MTDFSTIHLGPNVQWYRANHHWSREKLAREIGVSPTTVKRIENGTTNTTVSVLLELCAAFMTTADDLLSP